MLGTFSVHASMAPFHFINLDRKQRRRCFWSPTDLTTNPAVLAGSFLPSRHPLTLVGGHISGTLSCWKIKKTRRGSTRTQEVYRSGPQGKSETENEARRSQLPQQIDVESEWCTSQGGKKGNLGSVICSPHRKHFQPIITKENLKGHFICSSFILDDDIINCYYLLLWGPPLSLYVHREDSFRLGFSPACWISFSSERKSEINKRLNALYLYSVNNTLGFPGGSVGKQSACNVGDLGSISGLGRSPGEGNGNPLQYSCLEKSMDRGAMASGLYSPWSRKRVGHDWKINTSLSLFNNTVEPVPSPGHVSSPSPLSDMGAPASAWRGFRLTWRPVGPSSTAVLSLRRCLSWGVWYLGQDNNKIRCSPSGALRCGILAGDHLGNVGHRSLVPLPKAYCPPPMVPQSLRCWGDKTVNKEGRVLVWEILGGWGRDRSAVW